MPRQGAASRILLISGLLVLAAPVAGQATDVIINSQAPYWETGPRDPKLSNACSIGRFNERQMGRYTVQLHAKTGGAAVLGVAKGTGLNLWDPDKLAVVTEDYLFRQDGTSACEVFVGGRTPLDPTKPGAPGAKPGAPGAPPKGTAPAAPNGAAPATPNPPAPTAPAQPAVPGTSPQNNGPPT
jgi:hypothetical protein